MRTRIMDQTDSDDRAFPVSDTTITGKDHAVHDFRQAEPHVDTPPRPQETVPSNELALNREHNAALPIHTLPAEVFLQVIHLHMLDLLDFVDNTKGYNKRLIDLSGVCWYWYNLIRDSPPLWTRLDLSDPPKIVEIVLQRSSSHPLDIILTSPKPRLRARPQSVNLAKCRSFFGAVHPHRDRWRTLTIKVSSRWVEVVSAGLKEPAPNLEKLLFIDRHSMAVGQESDLFGGKAPQLTDITLNGVSIR
ncbi:hypothetical protein FRC01_013943, partial [Tulasnella sp. 417]